MPRFNFAPTLREMCKGQIGLDRGFWVAAYFLFIASQMFNFQVCSQCWEVSVEHGFTFCGNLSPLSLSIVNVYWKTFAPTQPSCTVHSDKNNNIFLAIKDLFRMDGNWWIANVVVMMASTFETEETEWLSSRHLRQRTRCVQGQFNLLWPCVGTRSFWNACLEVIWLFFWILSKSRFTMSENIISRAFQWDCDDFLQVETQ